MKMEDTPGGRYSSRSCWERWPASLSEGTLVRTQEGKSGMSSNSKLTDEGSAFPGLSRPGKFCRCGRDCRGSTSDGGPLATGNETNACEAALVEVVASSGKISGSLSGLVPQTISDSGVGPFSMPEGAPLSICRTVVLDVGVNKPNAEAVVLDPTVDFPGLVGRKGVFSGMSPANETRCFLTEDNGIVGPIWLVDTVTSVRPACESI